MLSFLPFAGCIAMKLRRHPEKPNAFVSALDSFTLFQWACVYLVLKTIIMFAQLWVVTFTLALFSRPFTQKVIYVLAKLKHAHTRCTPTRHA
jgi:hypothetical protein